ncbi:MAG: BlaI/MecI/CopY family transcriptional regulator [Polyangiaceae bacterium]
METEALTDLQLAVMKALWGLGEGTVGDVLTEMASAGRELAPTTVATLLQRLKKQGWVKSRKQGRQFMYRAQVAEEQAANGALNRLLRSFFGGRASALAAQLLESEQLSPADLKEMQALIKKKGA